ncbi:MAG: hypothetical protein MR209_00030 [Veillonellaceae bacterium]|nr:hypothetical protein [Veillonellaceae bacterium]
MAQLKITRPNGEVEYAELTTDKSKAGTDPLEVYKGGSKYYAKLDSKIDTHMYVEKSGVRRYVQKKMVTAWDKKKVSEVVDKPLPRSGWYQLRDNSEYGNGDLLWLIGSRKREIYLPEGAVLHHIQNESDKELTFRLYAFKKDVVDVLVAEITYYGDGPDEVYSEAWGHCTLYYDTDIEFIRP